MQVSLEEYKRIHHSHTYPSGGWLTGCHLGRQLKNICRTLGGLAYSLVGCDGTSISVLDPTPQALQFKALFAKLASLLPKIPLPPERFHPSLTVYFILFSDSAQVLNCNVIHAHMEE